jgi:hypothetical protein
MNILNYFWGVTRTENGCSNIQPLYSAHLHLISEWIRKKSPFRITVRAVLVPALKRSIFNIHGQTTISSDCHMISLFDAEVRCSSFAGDNKCSGCGDCKRFTIGIGVEAPIEREAVHILVTGFISLCMGVGDDSGIHVKSPTCIRTYIHIEAGCSGCDSERFPETANERRTVEFYTSLIHNRVPPVSACSSTECCCPN